jgi:hypothetical protein
MIVRFNQDRDNISIKYEEIDYLLINSFVI